MIAGSLDLKAVQTPVAANTGYLTPFTMPGDGVALEVFVAMDGNGTVIGDQVLTGVLYDATSGSLLAKSSEATVLRGSALAWVGMAFPTVTLSATRRYYAGFIAGPLSNAANMYASAWTPNMAGNARALTDFTNWQVEGGGGAPTFTRATSLPGTMPVAGVTTGGHAVDTGSGGVNQRWGQSLRVVGFPVVTGHTYTVSAYYYLVSGAGADIFYVTNTSFAGQAQMTPPATVGAWQRLVLTFTATYTGTAWSYVHSGVAPADFYLTGWQCTETPAAVAYADPPVVGPGGSPCTFNATYSSGAPSSLPSLAAAPDCTIWISYSPPFSLPDDVTDDWVATLAFSTAQEALASSGVLFGSGQYANVGWHGTLTDPEVGSFCIVNSSGPLADLVGERLKITYNERSVYAYCHTDGDILEDLSLYRRAFLALDYPAATEIEALVEIMAAST